MKPKGFIKLEWIKEAMELLCGTHEDLRFFIMDQLFPLTKWIKKWIDEYLDEYFKFPDICNF